MEYDYYVCYTDQYQRRFIKKKKKKKKGDS